MANIKHLVEAKVHEIATIHFEAMEQGTLNTSDLGLLSGEMGVIIFCAHYLKAFPEQKKEILFNVYKESFFDKLISGIDNYTYCSGLTGILDGLKYLNKQNLIEIDYTDIEHHYKTILQHFAQISILHEQYDYLHGGLGVLKYFCDDLSFVVQSLQALEHAAEKNEKYYKWVSKIGIIRESVYNISLSHGISSIVSVLSLLSDSTYEKQCNVILTNACNYIMSQILNQHRRECFFPSVSIDYEQKHGTAQSRLAWCYGDLGIATSLWQAGKKLKNKMLCKKAIEIFKYSSLRREPASSKVCDAGLCHGTASIAMMYHYMYHQTGDNTFFDTRNFWIESTLRMAYFEDGLAGYKTLNGNDNRWGCRYGILDGVTGIGLLLLSILDEKNANDKWLSFFLLN